MERHVAINIRLWPLLLLSSWISAQGMLMGCPPSVSTTTLTGPLLIGQRLPETLVVKDLNGTNRSLLSYKSITEIIVVFFLSTRCPQDPAYLSQFHRYYERFKNWHVSFVAVSTEKEESASDLAAQLKKAGLEKIYVVRDEEQRTLSLLKPAGFPWVVILDENGQLRYRGPLKPPVVKATQAPKIPPTDASEALDNIIGHVEPVTDPEPAGTPECALP